jgi:very-short-patch-repair endonuclease
LAGAEVTGAGAEPFVTVGVAPVIFSFCFEPRVPRALRVACALTAAAALVVAVSLEASPSWPPSRPPPRGPPPGLPPKIRGEESDSKREGFDSRTTEVPLLPMGKSCGGGDTRTSVRIVSEERPKTRFALPVSCAPTKPKPSGPLGEPRRRRLGGWRWRRQHIVAAYVVDFYCPALRLAVEVDGDVHSQQEQDALRDSDLSTLGCVVLRIRNDEVLAGGEAVVDRILRLCQRLSAS